MVVYELAFEEWVSNASLGPYYGRRFQRVERCCELKKKIDSVRGGVPVGHRGLKGIHKSMTRFSPPKD